MSKRSQFGCRLSNSEISSDCQSNAFSSSGRNYMTEKQDKNILHDGWPLCKGGKQFYWNDSYTKASTKLNPNLLQMLVVFTFWQGEEKSVL